jgi:hypothetical protein
MSDYMATIMMALEKGNLKGGLLMPKIAHDDWCELDKTQKCNCNPEISVETEDGLIYLNEDGSIKKQI